MIKNKKQIILLICMILSGCSIIRKNDPECIEYRKARYAAQKDFERSDPKPSSFAYFVDEIERKNYYAVESGRATTFTEDNIQSLCINFFEWNGCRPETEVEIKLRKKYPYCAETYD